MSSTVSWSSAAQSVSVSSRMPAQIFATPTGWVMNSSPEWRSWSAWRSQAKSKARSTMARSIVATATAVALSGPAPLSLGAESNSSTTAKRSARSSA